MYNSKCKEELTSSQKQGGKHNEQSEHGSQGQGTDGAEADEGSESLQEMGHL